MPYEKEIKRNSKVDSSHKQSLTGTTVQIFSELMSQWVAGRVVN